MDCIHPNKDKIGRRYAKIGPRSKQDALQKLRNKMMMDYIWDLPFQKWENRCLFDTDIFKNFMDDWSILDAQRSFFSPCETIEGRQLGDEEQKQYVGCSTMFIQSYDELNSETGTDLSDALGGRYYGHEELKKKFQGPHSGRRHSHLGLGALFLEGSGLDALFFLERGCLGMDALRR